MRNLLLILLIFIICGCRYHSQTDEPVTPVTYEAPQYRSDSSIGNLRRMALMPIEITSYKGKYDSKKEQLTAARSYEDECANYLASNKGYEIVVLRDTGERCQSGLVENVEYICNKELYEKWKRTTKKKKTVTTIREIGRAINVDSILVIWIKERRINEGNWGWIGCLNVFLMNIPLFYHIIAPDVGASIYETVTGQPVWSEAHSLAGEMGTSDFLVDIFADLENAVPRLLIK